MQKIACVFIYTGIHADLGNLITTPTKQNEIFDLCHHAIGLF